MEYFFMNTWEIPCPYEITEGLSRRFGVRVIPRTLNEFQITEFDFSPDFKTIVPWHLEGSIHSLRREEGPLLGKARGSVFFRMETNTVQRHYDERAGEASSFAENTPEYAAYQSGFLVQCMQEAVCSALARLLELHPGQKSIETLEL